MVNSSLVYSADSVLMRRLGILLQAALLVALASAAEAGAGRTCSADGTCSSHEPSQIVSPSHAELQARCNASLLEFHQALTDWFTGAANESQFSSLVRALRLAPGSIRRMAEGKSIDAEGMMTMLEGAHGVAKPGAFHKPDITTIKVVKHGSSGGRDDSVARLSLTFSFIEVPPAPPPTPSSYFSSLFKSCRGLSM